MKHFLEVFYDLIYLLQRTERGPKDRNIAETDCKQFADMLIERLLRVQKEREKEERMQMSLKAINKVRKKTVVLITGFAKSTLTELYRSNVIGPSSY